MSNSYPDLVGNVLSASTKTTLQYSDLIRHRCFSGMGITSHRFNEYYSTPHSISNSEAMGMSTIDGSKI